MSTVLVTGGSGFVGGHVILQLLNQGHSVRTTVRSAKRVADVRKMLAGGGADPGPKLGFFTAVLERDEGWAEAVQGCDFVIHVASPLPISAPKTEDEVRGEVTLSGARYLAPECLRVSYCQPSKLLRFHPVSGLPYAGRDTIADSVSGRNNQYMVLIFCDPCPGELVRDGTDLASTSRWRVPTASSPPRQRGETPLKLAAGTAALHANRTAALSQGTHNSGCG